MVAKVIPLRRALTPEGALDAIRSAVAHSGAKLGWTDHVWPQMEERQIVARQVLTVLEEGSLKKGPNWSDEYQDWVCVLKKFVSGRTVTVVVGVDDGTKGVSIITAY